MLSPYTVITKPSRRAGIKLHGMTQTAILDLVMDLRGPAILDLVMGLRSPSCIVTT